MDSAGGENLASTARTVEVSLSVGRRRRCEQWPKVYRTEINDVLLTALVEALDDGQESGGWWWRWRGMA